MMENNTNDKVTSLFKGNKGTIKEADEKRDGQSLSLSESQNLSQHESKVVSVLPVCFQATIPKFSIHILSEEFNSLVRIYF